MANNNQEQLRKLPRFDLLVKNRATLPVFIIRDALDEAVLLGNSECARYYYSVSTLITLLRYLNNAYLVIVYDYHIKQNNVSGDYERSRDWKKKV